MERRVRHSPALARDSRRARRSVSGGGTMDGTAAAGAAVARRQLRARSADGDAGEPAAAAAAPPPPHPERMKRRRLRPDRGAADTGPRREVVESCALCYREDLPNEDPLTNQWIQCDDCRRWVHSKCDGITDVSVYDESKTKDPEHYSCPMCRRVRLLAVGIADPFGVGGGLGSDVDSVQSQASGSDSDTNVEEPTLECVEQAVVRELADVRVRAESDCGVGIGMLDRSTRKRLQTLEAYVMKEVANDRQQLAAQRDEDARVALAEHQARLASLEMQHKRGLRRRERDYARHLRARANIWLGRHNDNMHQAVREGVRDGSANGGAAAATGGRGDSGV